jgi:hypothetical protein
MKENQDTPPTETPQEKEQESSTTTETHPYWSTYHEFLANI